MLWVVFDFLQFSGIGIGGGHPKVDLAFVYDNFKKIVQSFLQTIEWCGDKLLAKYHPIF